MGKNCNETFGCHWLAALNCVDFETPEGLRRKSTVPLPTGFDDAAPTNRYRQQPERMQRMPPVVHKEQPIFFSVSKI